MKMAVWRGERFGGEIYKILYCHETNKITSPGQKILRTFTGAQRCKTERASKGFAGSAPPSPLRILAKFYFRRPCSARGRDN